MAFTEMVSMDDDLFDQESLVLLKNEEKIHHRIYNNQYYYGPVEKRENLHFTA
ncbi:MAG: hypothetical protein OS130_03710 [Thermodesulfobacteriota bacterium]|jgi:hypothetical protein|nr:MAG: hypothetical protein OS130_03710 [Thermodesulfobacteriota bacterium]